MSLCLWYPLNGSFENKGCIDVQYSVAPSSSASYTSKGFCEKSLCTNSTMPSINIPTTEAILNNDHFSISCWIYNDCDPNTISNDANGCVRIFGWGGVNTGASVARPFISLYPRVGRIYAKSWRNTGENDTLVTLSTDDWGDLESYRWNNIVFVFKNPNAMLYVNGELVASSDEWNYEFDTFSTTTALMSLPNSNVYMQDYRVYNHALSKKEVKELSKGLLIRYPLNNEYVEDNLYDGAGLNKVAVYETVTPTAIKDSPVGQYSTEFSVGNDRIITPVLTHGKKFTISAWFKFQEVPELTEGVIRLAYSGTVPSVRLDIYRSSNLYYYLRLITVNANITDGDTTFITRVDSTKTLECLSDKSWHHVVGVIDDTTMSIYLDGIHINSVDIPGDWAFPADPNYWVIGYNTSSTPIYLADVRMYITALSADDILDMYKTKAIIDENGTIWTHELITSDDATDFNVTKSGVMTTKEFAAEGGSLDVRGVGSIPIDASVLFPSDVISHTPIADVNNRTYTIFSLIKETKETAGKIHIHCKFKWTGFVGACDSALENGNTFRLYVQACGFEDDDTTPVWTLSSSSTSFFINGSNVLTTLVDTADGEYVVDYEINLPTTTRCIRWMFRSDYSNGIGNIKVSDVRVTWADRWLDGTDKVKVGKSFISANGIVEL